MLSFVSISAVWTDRSFLIQIVLMEKYLFVPFWKRYPIILALFAQVLSLFILRNIAWVMGVELERWPFIFLQGLISASLSVTLFKLPKWFFTISILFPLSLMLATSYSSFSQTFWGAGFLLLVLTFSHTMKERVPLYLSNKVTHETLRQIVNERKCQKVLDIGSGLGGVVRALSAESVSSVGVESAPLLWFISTLLSRLSGKGQIKRQNIWDTSLSQYDMVYAFLSPAVMDKLYEKIKKEMRPGTLFISNSFAIAHCEYDALWVLSDERETHLYFYEIK